MGVGGSLTENDVKLAITLLAETKGAVQDIKLLERELKTLEAEASKAKSMLKSLGTETTTPLNNIATSAKKVETGLDGTTKAATKTKEGFFSLNNVARTMFGTFTAMGIFLVTKFVGDAIAKTLDGVKQLELALFNLAVAERSLSEQGIDITPEDFQGIIKAVESLNLAISKIDITKGVANLATGLRDLGLDKEQLENLSKAAAIIATSKGISMENVVSQFVGGIAKGGKGLADLDIQVDAAVIKQKALDEQLVESEEAWNNLTAAQRQSIETQALYLIILENAEDRLANLGLLEGSVTIASQELTSAWEDFTASAGKDFAPAIVSGMSLVTKAIIGWSKSLEIISLLFQRFLIGASVAFFTYRDIVQGSIHSLDDFGKAIERNRIIATAVVKESFAKDVLPDDTPTGTPPPVIGEGIEENAEDIAGALEKANEEIIKAELKLQQDLQDIAIDLGRKMVDITEEYAKKRADAYLDYNNKVGDINRDFNRKLESIDAKAQESRNKARADQLEREREFQNKLQEMREEFLMDLDDALHNRDARQILKLIKQYELEKLQAERRHALEQTNAKKDEQLRQQSYVAERKLAEKERQEKLADAQRDYQLKLAKLKAEEDAEVQSAVTAANRKTEDLMKANQDRLAIIAADLVNQFNLTKVGLDAVLNLYRAYYGSGGYISQVMAGMGNMMNGFRNNGISSRPMPPTNLGSFSSGDRRGGMAEGGTIVANRPTTVTFGERGAEQASFTPIGRSGKDVNKIFSSLSNSGDGMGSGMLTIALDLSPDLEARVIGNTLSKAAEIVTNIQRRKN